MLSTTVYNKFVELLVDKVMSKVNTRSMEVKLW